MKLRELLQDVEVVSSCVDMDTEILGVTYDSRKVQPGWLFVAVTGFVTDGNLYIGYGLELYKLALNRVDIVKGMIDGVEPRFGDQVKLARQSYEHICKRRLTGRIQK